MSLTMKERNLWIQAVLKHVPSHVRLSCESKLQRTAAASSSLGGGGGGGPSAWSALDNLSATERGAAVVDVLEPDVFNEFIRGIRNTDNLRTAFLHAMGELGLPRITPNQMRHLYETHIRYTDKLTNEQLKDEWEEIGHSEGVARKFYGELYKHILN